MRTIRLQLLVVYLISLLLPPISLAVAGVATWLLLFPSTGSLDLSGLSRYAEELKPIVETRLEQGAPADLHHWLQERLQPRLPSYLSVQVLDPSGQVVANSDGPSGGTVSLLTFYQEVRPPGFAEGRYHTVEQLNGTDGEPLGLMVVSSSQRATAVIHLLGTDPRDRIGTILLIGAPLLSLLTSVALFWRLGTNWIRPLTTVSQAVNRVAEGDLTVSVPVERQDEFGHLARAVQSMVTRLRAAEEKSAAADRARRYWVAAASHDLRTPLTVIFAQVEQLLRSDLPADALRQGLTAVSKNAEQLRQMVDGLFELAALDAQTMEWPRRPADLAELIRRETADLLPAIEEAGMALTVDLPEYPCPALVAPDKIRRAYQNLVQNAIRYGSSGESLTVRLSSPRTAWWRVEVIDRGPGLDEGNLPWLFEHLTPAGERVPSDRGAGGLGLTIVKEIIRRHGGSVGAQNLSEGGACFWFELPVLRQ